ncbi:hypothetical protein ABZ527_28935 [Streptomyces griseofuscus]|uniref:hypothetical protein n=1 Tax=Streptomyces griseofuscus TaxID=146922 RepID=UPI0033E27170
MPGAAGGDGEFLGEQGAGLGRPAAAQQRFGDVDAPGHVRQPAAAAPAGQAGGGQERAEGFLAAVRGELEPATRAQQRQAGPAGISLGPVETGGGFAEPAQGDEDLRVYGGGPQVQRGAAVPHGVPCRGGFVPGGGEVAELEEGFGTQRAERGRPRGGLGLRVEPCAPGGGPVGDAVVQQNAGRVEQGRVRGRGHGGGAQQPFGRAGVAGPDGGVTGVPVGRRAAAAVRGPGGSGSAAFGAVGPLRPEGASGHRGGLHWVSEPDGCGGEQQPQAALERFSRRVGESGAATGRGSVAP